MYASKHASYIAHGILVAFPCGYHGRVPLLYAFDVAEPPIYSPSVNKPAVTSLLEKSQVYERVRWCWYGSELFPCVGTISSVICHQGGIRFRGVRIHRDSAHSARKILGCHAH